MRVGVQLKATSPGSPEQVVEDREKRSDGMYILKKKESSSRGHSTVDQLRRTRESCSK